MDGLVYKVGLAIDTVGARVGQERYVVIYDTDDVVYLSNLPTNFTAPYIRVKTHVDGKVRCFLHNASSEQWRILREELRDVLKKRKTYLLFVTRLPDEVLLAGKNWQNSPASNPVPPTPPKPERNTGRVPLFVPSPPYGEAPGTLRRHGGAGDYAEFVFVVRARSL